MIHRPKRLSVSGGVSESESDALVPKRDVGWSSKDITILLYDIATETINSYYHYILLLIFLFGL